jgi:hypothetical protein
MKKVVRLTESDLFNIVKRVINEQTIPILSVLAKPGLLTMSNNPNSNIIFLSSRDPKNPSKIIPNSTYKYKVSGSWTFFNFDVKIRNFKRNSLGGLEAEVQPTNSKVLAAMEKMTPSKNLTKDGWLKIYVEANKVNDAINELKVNRGVSAEIDAGKGVTINLEYIK